MKALLNHIANIILLNHRRLQTTFYYCVNTPRVYTHSENLIKLMLKKK